jgi:hypothetical protein
MHEMYAHDIREEEWNVADCDNHKPWSEYREWEIMWDLHAVSVGDWMNPFWGICTPDGVFCSQKCADEFCETIKNTPVNP